MLLQDKTILITGGSSGIGLELARRLSEKNNKVIICSRSLDKLQRAKMEIASLEIFQCDISKKEECVRLSDWVKKNYPKCSILINNAAITHTASFYKDVDILSKLEAEIHTNFLAPVHLTKHFIAIIEKNSNPSIINITTGLVYAPRVIYPFYSATKAALHSFTQMLRIQMNSKKIAIIEVMFPAVDTPWHKGNAPDIAISTEKAVDEMISSVEKGQVEVKVGKVKLIHLISRLAPGFALKKINNL
ncbi:SDR family NAD(P)-dependent oxidoreductase [Kriegella sp. EG-1]|nr:SDR family NAD(P)-dependent oxidoreductase [Flavobacteriaceae bacterium EG-1]